MYSVNGKMVSSFVDAITAAKAAGANVVEVATGLVRWSPAPKAAKRVEHVLITDDGRAVPFSKVRR